MKNYLVLTAGLLLALSVCGQSSSAGVISVGIVSVLCITSAVINIIKGAINGRYQ